MEYQKDCHIKFDERFYLPETRSGFEIMGLMKRAWAAQLEVLWEIDRICKKYGLTWFADGGTLLGAIRHKGFIPWDDDIDITMKRHDYNILMSVLQSELPDGFYWFCPTRVTWDPLAFLRVINTSQINFDRSFLDKYHGCPYLCGVDIFPLDGVPKDEEEWEILQTIAKSILDAVDIIKKEEVTNVNAFLMGIENSCGVRIDKSGNVVEQLMVIVDRLASSYREEESDYLATLCMYCNGTQKAPRHKDWYSETVIGEFEGLQIPIPIGSRQILEALYGSDYMTPIYGGQNHDYPFFAKQKNGAHSIIVSEQGYEEREHKVADYYNLNDLEVFEYQLLEKHEQENTYLYFCQSEMVQARFGIDGTVTVTKK